MVIAGWVAYAVSTPRNFENSMNAPMAQLGGSSINTSMDEAKAEAYAAMCEEATARANEAWDRAVEKNGVDRAQSMLDELDRQVEQYCI